MLHSKVNASATLAMLQKVREMKLQGLDVVSFAAGEPDFETPRSVSEAAYKSILAGNTRYGPTQGQLNFREAVAEDYRKRLNVAWAKPEHVIVTVGSKQGIYLYLAALLEQGDEVLVPIPYWVSYPDVITAALGKPLSFETKQENGFFPTVEELEKIYNPKVKALVFSSPCNPTGTMISKEHLKKIIDWCIGKKVTLLYDELYERLMLDGTPHVSALSLVDHENSEYVVSVNATSKTMAMTGWRLGYLVSHKNNVAALSPLQGQMLTSVPGFIQDAGLEGIRNGDAILNNFLSHYKNRLKVLSDGLKKIPNVNFLMPSGAFYLFADMSFYLKKLGFASDKEFSLELLNQERVVLVSGSSFGMPGWFRFSFATNEADIQKGVERLKRFLKVN